MNKRIVIVLILIGLFGLNQFLIPSLLSSVSWNTEILIETLSFVSMVSVPIAILVLLHDIVMLRLAVWMLVIISVSFYILDITNVSGTIAGYAYLILVLANIGLLVAGLLVQNELYFGRRATIFLVALVFLVFLRYSPLVSTVYVFLSDFNTMTMAGWNLPRAFSIFYSVLYFLSFLFQLATLDAVVEEKVKIGYE